MTSSFTFGRRLSLAALFATAGLLTTACLKDEPAVVVSPSPSPSSPAADEAIIQKYISDKAFTGAQRQASGLYYVPLTTNASAVQAAKDKTVSVLYTGLLLDGTVFDASSRNGNKPLIFPLGQGNVIPGWDEGIALMHKGDKGILLIPPALAYGAQGSRAIPPNAVLRFDVELTEVQ